MSKHCEHCTDSCDLYFDVHEAALIVKFLRGQTLTDHTAVNKGTVSNPAWCRGYDDGVAIGLGTGEGRERAAIVAWLNRFADPCGVIVIDLDDLALIERGEHLRSDDE